MKPKPKPKHITKKIEDSSSLWKWNQQKSKTSDGNQFPVAEFLQDNYKKFEEMMLGPGGGIGIGCGVGAGFGLVGGIGFGGHTKLVFGVGMGCGIGFGIGYGRGIGYGFSLESLETL